MIFQCGSVGELSGAFPDLLQLVQKRKAYAIIRSLQMQEPYRFVLHILKKAENER